LEDMLDITDSNNTLIIKGDSGDILELDTDEGGAWKQDGKEESGGVSYQVYTGTGANSTVKLLIDDEITIHDI
jgi:hypothetical protein